LNRPAALNPPDIEATHTDIPIAVTPSTTGEVQVAIKQITSGKAAGPDNIPAKALKLNNCKHAPRSIQKDLRGMTDADRMERKTSYQHTKERSSEHV
uniref:WH2 domain-containing protein n=1 Tax=Schistosoma curassoni TaxID=6186 RepID=A0A183KZY2_9TREM